MVGRWWWCVDTLNLFLSPPTTVTSRGIPEYTCWRCWYHIPGNVVVRYYDISSCKIVRKHRYIRDRDSVSDKQRDTTSSGVIPGTGYIPGPGTRRPKRMRVQITCCSGPRCTASERVSPHVILVDERSSKPIRLHVHRSSCRRPPRENPPPHLCTLYLVPGL